MTYTPIPRGSTDWDVPVNAAFTDQDTRITDNAGNIAANTSDLSSQNSRIQNIEALGAELSQLYGYAAVAFDPVVALNSLAMPLGQIQMVRVDLIRDATISTITQCVVGTGTTLTAGQNFAGIYNASGVRLAQTADQTTAWGTTGTKDMALTAPVFLPAGTYYVAYLVNAAASPTFLRIVNAGALSGFINHNFTVSNGRFTTVGATGSATSLPASIDLSTRAFSITSWWAGLS